MKRSSTTSKKGSGGVGVDAVENSGYKYSEVGIIDWELRPGGLLVQKRVVGSDGGGGGGGSGGDATSGGPMIKIKVSHGLYHHDISVLAQSTFGDLKRVLAHETGLEPKEQRLLFRGKEKEDEECLHMAGVVDMSKVILLEDPASKEKKLEEMKRNQCILQACEAVAIVRAEADKLSDKVVALEAAVHNGTKVADKEFVVLTELLMLQLLKLDTVEADGEAKVQRRVEVRRVQSFVDVLDNLKTRNSNPFSNSSNAMTAPTKWGTFDPGVGSLGTSKPKQSAAKITRDWELFD